MYLFQRQGKEYKVIDKEWENVRDQLVNMVQMVASHT